MHFGGIDTFWQAEQSPADATATPARDAAENNNEDTSYALSFRAESSPLFDPVLQSQLAAGNSDPIAGSSLAMNSNNSGAGWFWQRASSVFEAKREQLPSQDAAEGQTPSGPIAMKEERDPPMSAPHAQEAEAEPLQNKAQSPNNEETDKAAETDKATGLAETSKQGDTTNGDKAGPEAVEPARSPDAAVDTPASPSPTFTGHVDESCPAQELSEEAGQRSPSPNIEEQLIPQPELDASPEQARFNKEQHSPPDQPETERAKEPTPPTIDSTKRRRRSTVEMLNESAKEFVKKGLGPRSIRRGSAPVTRTLAAPTPLSTRIRGRKSMLAKVATETPRKRGRPRKSEAATTPAVTIAGTTTLSTSKRGRPRRSEIPSTPATTTKTPGRRGRPRMSETISTPATVPMKAAKRGRPRKLDMTPISKSANATPGKSAKAQTTSAESNVNASVGRHQKIAVLLSPPAASDNTPKRRGRPPKTPPKATLAKLATSSTETRTAYVRVVPSPAKRTRPMRKTAAAASQKTTAKETTSKSNTNAAGATRAGKKAAPGASAPADPPKRRGRPPKNKTANDPSSSAEEASKSAPKRGRRANSENETTALAKPAPRKRGRPAATKKDAIPAPATTRKRTRGTESSAPDEVEAVTEPPAEKRGRPSRAAASKQPASTSEPPAKRQRTTRRAAEEVNDPEPARAVRGKSRGVAKNNKTEEAPAKSRGRAKKDVDEAPVADPEPIQPKGRGRGRQVQEEPAAPKTRDRAAKSGKGELASSKVASEEGSKKGGRPGKATKSGALAKAAAQDGVKKTRATGTKNQAAAPKRSMRLRAGNQALPNIES